jgi:hypothetical protein
MEIGRWSIRRVAEGRQQRVAGVVAQLDVWR